MQAPSGYLFKELTLSGDFDRYIIYKNDKILDSKRLENLGRINIFVGANNSGKSRLIRNIAKSQELIFEPPQNVQPLGRPLRQFNALEEYLRAIWKHGTDFQGFVNAMGLRNNLDIFQTTEFKGLIASAKIGEPSAQKMVNMVDQLLSTGDRHSTRFRDRQLASDLEQIKADLKKCLEYERAAQRLQRVYIPTLRTLRELGDKKLLKLRTAQDYEIDEQIVFTGQSLYEDVEALLRGNLSDREALRHFEEWLGQTFFNGQPVALIPRIKQTTLTVKIGDEEEKPIHELGDGIQALLILTFPLFRNENKHLIAFIEEPELFLHPWLQRAFLEMLSERFPRHQYFFTTHSNHFLDLTLDLPDVCVFALEKKIDESQLLRERPALFNIYQVSRDDRKPLELLGVRNSSVFLSNCTIWVEGITDRRYIAHWLRLYQARTVEGRPSMKTFKEDLHYSFVEYGGGNITHFSFLDHDEMDDAEKGILVNRLCAKLFLITDADGDKKKERKDTLQKRLGDRYYCLPGREIENLIKPEVLQKVLQTYGEESPPLFRHTSYIEERLGRFIDTKMGNSRKRKGTYADEYGVLKGKVLFCDKAVSVTQDWSDVSEPAEELVKRIYDFIAAMNPK